MTIACSRLSTCGNLEMDGLVSLEDALLVADATVVPLAATERIDLLDAVGRVSARSTKAPLPMPAFRQSAMDGFAVHSADFAGDGPWHLAVTDTVAAGDRPGRGSLARGEAARIYTGAPVPDAADAVVMVEHCEDEGNAVVVRHRPTMGDNVRDRGSDIERGAELVAAGTVLGGRHVGLLAANGFIDVEVVRRPRVGVFSTGSELLANGAPEEGRVHDANRPMLIALARQAGADVVDLGIVDDDLRGTVRFFRDVAGTVDLLISSGAVSVGARDFIRPAFIEAGGTVRAWKVALKPGKPVLFGTHEDTTYLGLPGNPLSAFVGFHLFGRRQIFRLGGRRLEGGEAHAAIARFSLSRKTGRTELVPARVVARSGDGVPLIELIGNGSSGTLQFLCQAEGLAVIAADQARISTGDPVQFIPFCSGAPVC